MADRDASNVDAAVARLESLQTWPWLRALEPADALAVALVCTALAAARQEIAEALEEAEACGQVMIKSRSEREAEADSRTAIERLARVIAEGDLEKARQRLAAQAQEITRLLQVSCDPVAAEYQRAAQRERDAQICDTVAAKWFHHAVAPVAAKECAAAIRAQEP